MFLNDDLLPFSALQKLSALQNFINAILEWLVYRIIIGPQEDRHFAFAIALPFVILEPIYLMHLLDIRHVGLIMDLRAMPIVNSLWITEVKNKTHIPHQIFL